MNSQKSGRTPKRSPWRTLAVSAALILGFAFLVGPWIQRHVPIIDEVFTRIEEQSINATGYYYTEIEGAYAGEKYLRDAIRLSDPDEARLNLGFISGIAICLLILGLGFRFLPME